MFAIRGCFTNNREAKVCLLIRLFIYVARFKGLAPAYLEAFCTKGSAVSGRSAATIGLVPGHKGDKSTIVA